MEHDADADAGADVRGAGGEVAEAVVVGVGDAGFDQVVELVDLFPGGSRDRGRSSGPGCAGGPLR